MDFNMQSRPSHDCYQLANRAYYLAQKAESDWEIEHHCVTGIVFTAFAIESMINHFVFIIKPQLLEVKSDRKRFHKEFFKLIQLPHYLGDKNYQVAKECFELRDSFAHGKTSEDNLICDMSEEALIDKLGSISSTPFRKATIERLADYLKVALDIQNDIQKKGALPNNLSRSLNEFPLNMQGIISWNS